MGTAPVIGASVHDAGGFIVVVVVVGGEDGLCGIWRVGTRARAKERLVKIDIRGRCRLAKHEEMALAEECSLKA